MTHPYPDARPLSVALLALVLSAGMARAAFTPVERFEGLTLGPIGGQNEWVAPDEGSTVALDPADGGNQVLSVITESSVLYRPLAVPDALARMVFLRFRLAGQLNMSFGLSDLASPSRFDHFEAELSVDNSPMELRVNDGGTYRVLSPVAPDTWYNCWIFVDNLANTTRVWLHDRSGSGATEADRLSVEGLDLFAFRNTSAADLRTFYIKTGGGNGVSGPLLLDDVFIEDSEAMNLTHPVPWTAAVQEVAPGAGLALEAARPNPFRTRAALRFALPRAADVDLAVYDPAGRRVATLERGVLPAGLHEAVWDGRQAAGGPCAAGVYFVRLAAGTESASRRIVLVP